MDKLKHPKTTIAGIGVALVGAIQLLAPALGFELSPDLVATLNQIVIGLVAIIGLLAGDGAKT